MTSMATAKITIIGLENYLNMDDKSLFDNIKLPEGIVKNDLKNTIMLNAGDLEVLYPDPDYMKDVISLWFRTHYRTFDKWMKALAIEYEPLWNYDRTEEYTDEHEGSDTRTKDNKYNSKGISSSEGSTTGKTTNDLKSETEYGKSTTDTKSVSAYNSSSWENREKDVISEDGTDTTKDTGSITNNNSSKDSTTSNDSGTSNQTDTGSDKWKNTHKAHLYGNIGVTTSQQMLEAELEIARFNIYEQISDLFIQDNCIMCY